MFQSLMGVSSHLLPSLSLSTSLLLTKFSIALLLTSTSSSAVPLNMCIVIGSSSLLDLSNIYIVLRHRVLAKAANLDPRQNPFLLLHQRISVSFLRWLRSLSCL